MVDDTVDMGVCKIWKVEWRRGEIGEEVLARILGR